MRLAVVGMALLVVTSCGASMAEAPAGLSAESRELAAYLATTYKISSRLVGQQAAAMPSFQEITEASPQGALDQQAAQIMILEEYLAALQAIDPPARAADFHARSVVIAEEGLANNRAMQDATASGDPDLILQASQGLLSQAGELLQEGFAVASEGATIAEEVLAGQEDPEGRYIIELLALRTSPSARQMEAFGSQLLVTSTIDEVTELIETGISAMAALEADYSAITPPPAWSELHEQQLQILADAIDLYSRIADAVENPTKILELFEEMLDFVGRAPELSAKVSSKLADYFEGLA